MVTEVQVEATFPDGNQNGHCPQSYSVIQSGGNAMKIGEIMPLEREITLNEGKPSLTLMVTNTGDRPVQ